MRRLAVVLLSLIVGCSSVGELAPTVTTASSSRSSTTIGPSVTSSTTVVETTVPWLPLTGLRYEEVAEMRFPTHMVPWGPVSALVATKEGQVWLFDGTSLSEDPALDIGDQVRDSGEQGLLAIAVHPEDTNRLYVHYSASDGDTVVSEFTWDNGFFVDEMILLRLEQPAGNHNGGMIQFGPGGGLFLGLGDGGGGGDRFDNGQNFETLLGGLVRIDVDSGESELFQYGLRNPWRFWIDGSTIFVADVGQGSFEEISVAQLTKGVNYGWPITEGLHCFRPNSGCDTTGLTLPVVEVSHGDADTCSITGGVVYGGDAIPELQGTFFFSDYCGGYLRGLRDDVVVEYTDQVGVLGAVASFGTDDQGEMYVLTPKALLKLVPVRG